MAERFTPTTEMVRSAYSHNPLDDYHNPDKAGAWAISNGHAFDRWLAERDREVSQGAWDEGYAAALIQAATGRPTRNPYLEEAA